MSWAEKAFQISGDDLFRRAFFKLDEAQITWPARNERILAYCDYNTYAYVFATNPLRAKEIYFCAEVSDIAGTPSTLAQILLHESFHLITQKTDECFVTRLVKRTFETIHEPIAFEDAYMRGGCH